MADRLLISTKVLDEFRSQLTTILASAPHGIEFIPFDYTRPPQPSALGTVSAAYYSCDIWDGTDKSALSPAAAVFWNLIEQAPQLEWIHVFSSGTYARGVGIFLDNLRRYLNAEPLVNEAYL